jgi:hypothetical protein
MPFDTSGPSLALSQASRASELWFWSLFTLQGLFKPSHSLKVKCLQFVQADRQHVVRWRIMAINVQALISHRQIEENC